MQTNKLAVLFLLLAAVSACTYTGTDWEPLQTVFDAKGCPLRVEPDKSCDSFLPKTFPDTACRKTGEKIGWQAIDEAGRPYNGDFEVRFKKADKIAAPDGWWRMRCAASDKGLLKCKIKNDHKSRRENPYKYVIQVDNTECPVLDPRIYVN